MLTEDESNFFGQFIAESSAAALTAIDEAVVDAGGRALSDHAKNRCHEILDDQFAVVLQDKRIGVQDQITTDKILSVVCPAAVVDTRLSGEILEIVQRAFVNFAEGLRDFYDAELRSRTQRRK